MRERSEEQLGHLLLGTRLWGLACGWPELKGEDHLALDGLDERRKEHREQNRGDGMKHPSAELLLSTEAK